MKTVKERVSELKNEIETRIINGDFEVVKIEENRSSGYFNIINISIDGVDFRFSVSETKTYLCLHNAPVEIKWNGYEIGELKHLYEPLEAQELESKEKQIKKLQDEIRALQAK